MSYFGPQEPCPKCGWENFTIRSRCRNCGADLRSPEEARRETGFSAPPTVQDREAQS